jgi:hypothetical protein
MNDLLLENKKILSEGLRFHLIEGISVDNNIYRPGSTKYFDLFREVRDLSQMGLYELNSEEKFFINETDIGEWDLFEGDLVPLDFPLEYTESINEAEYKGREVELNKPKRGGSKKYYVYVKNPKTGRVKKVEWGARGMSVGIHDPARRKSFAARHKCTTRNDKTTASYWACRTGRYPHLTGAKKKYTWW